MFQPEELPDEILDAIECPNHYGKPKPPFQENTAGNTCGDRVTIYFDGKYSFEHIGCCISKAGTDMFLDLVTNGTIPAEEEFLQLFPKLSIARTKCWLLGLRCFRGLHATKNNSNQGTDSNNNAF